MLVLSRRIDEKIILPTLGVTIQVVAAKTGVVRVGVTAHDTVPVFREEVLERLDPEERARLVPAAPDRLVEQARLLTVALQTAIADLSTLRRQFDLWQREDLGLALDRITGELQSAQQKASGKEAVSTTIAPVSALPAELVAY